MPILLEFVNQSTDTNNSQVIIFGESSGPAVADDAVDTPFPIHRVIPIPKPGERVSVEFPDRSVSLDVVSPESAGQPPSPPAHLVLPDASSTTVFVQGGGAFPIYFVIGVPEELLPPRPATPAAEPPGTQRPSAPKGFLAKLIAAIRRAWRMVTGG